MDIQPIRSSIYMYINACSSIAHTSHNTVAIQSYSVVDIEGSLLFCPVMIMVSLPSGSRCGTHTCTIILCILAITQLWFSGWSPKSIVCMQWNSISTHILYRLQSMTLLLYLAGMHRLHTSVHYLWLEYAICWMLSKLNI